MKHGNRYKHGHARGPGMQSKEYRAWAKMKTRCTNPNDNRYAAYGARGISICPRWFHSFENFLADMGHCPSGHSIGRIDNDGNYEPKNCRWETNTQQANNRRSNHLLTIRGVTRNIRLWADAYGISYQMIKCRLYRGWSADKAIFTPTKRPDISYA